MKPTGNCHRIVEAAAVVVVVADDDRKSVVVVAVADFQEPTKLSSMLD